MTYKFDYWLAKNGDADALYIDGNLVGDIRLQKDYSIEVPIWPITNLTPIVYRTKRKTRP